MPRQGCGEVGPVKALLGPAHSGGRVSDLDGVRQDLHHAVGVYCGEEFDLTVRPLQGDVTVRSGCEEHDLRHGRRAAELPLQDDLLAALREGLGFLEAQRSTDIVDELGYVHVHYRSV